MTPILRKNSRILFLGKLSISLGLIAYLIWLIDWERAIQTINDTNGFPLFIALFLSLARLVFASWRMRIILADSNVTFSYWQAYSAYLLGSFYSIFLPGIMGSDVVRIGRCTMQTHCQIGTSIASVLLERISGVFALIGILFFTYLLYPSTVLPMLGFEEISSVMIVAAIGIIVMAAFLLGRRLWLKVFLRIKRTGRIWSFIDSAMQTLKTLRTPTLGKALVLSVLFQAIDIVVTFLLSRSLGFNVPLIVFFAIVPLVYLAIALPISLGGLGVREGMLVFLLAQYDVVASDAVMLSFLVYLNYVIVGSLGGIGQLVETLSRKKATPPLTNP